MINPFLFLVGCARSGTTLLKRMVDAHPRIAIVGMGDLLHRYEEEEGVTPVGHITEELVRELLKKGHLSYRTPLPEASLKDLEYYLSSGHYPSYVGLISGLFDRQAEERGKALAGYKNVAATLKVPLLSKLFPEARFIHIIRDGRDVTLSALNWRGAKKLAETFPTWNEDPVSTAALWWEWHVRKAREDGGTLDKDLYYELFYENLVEDPEGECARLCEFLGVPYDGGMLRFHEDRKKDGPNLDAKHAWKPPVKGLRNWQTQMSTEDVERFEAVAGGLLDELGYPRGTDRPSPEALRHAQRLRERFEGRPLPRPLAHRRRVGTSKPRARTTDAGTTGT